MANKHSRREKSIIGKCVLKNPLLNIKNCLLLKICKKTLLSV